MTGYTLDEQSTRRLAAITRRVEGMSPEEIRGEKSRIVPVQLVEITGAKDETTGLYPGTVITYTDTGAARTKNTVVAEVRVYFSNVAVELKSGNELLCRFSGVTEPDGDDETYGLFVPAIPVKVIEVVTDVNCVDGEIVCDYEEIVVLDFSIPEA